LKVNGIGLVNDDRKTSYTTIVSQFNDYSKEKGLNIELNIEVFSPSNSSSFSVEFGSVLDHILKKRNKKYDIIFYDSMYFSKYSPHLVDLKEYIPDDQIALFSDKIVSQSCLYEDRLVGLVNSINFFFFFFFLKLNFNKKLLD